MARARKSGLGKGLDSLIPMGMELEGIQKSAPKKAETPKTEEQELKAEESRIFKDQPDRTESGSAEKAV